MSKLHEALADLQEIIERGDTVSDGEMQSLVDMIRETQPRNDDTRQLEELLNKLMVLRQQNPSGLTTTVLKRQLENNDLMQAPSCAICMEPMTLEQATDNLTEACAQHHRFHTTCLNQLPVPRRCPICRQPLTAEAEHQLRQQPTTAAAAADDGRPTRRWGAAANDAPAPENRGGFRFFFPSRPAPAPAPAAADDDGFDAEVLRRVMAQSLQDDGYRTPPAARPARAAAAAAAAALAAADPVMDDDQNLLAFLFDADSPEDRPRDTVWITWRDPADDDDDYSDSEAQGHAAGEVFAAPADSVAPFGRASAALGSLPLAPYGYGPDAHPLLAPPLTIRT